MHFRVRTNLLHQAGTVLMQLPDQNMFNDTTRSVCFGLVGGIPHLWFNQVLTMDVLRTPPLPELIYACVLHGRILPGCTTLVNLIPTEPFQSDVGYTISAVEFDAMDVVSYSSSVGRSMLGAQGDRDGFTEVHRDEQSWWFGDKPISISEARLWRPQEPIAFDVHHLVVTGVAVNSNTITDGSTRPVGHDDAQKEAS